MMPGLVPGRSGMFGCAGGVLTLASLPPPPFAARGLKDASASASAVAQAISNGDGNAFASASAQAAASGTQTMGKVP